MPRAEPGAYGPGTPYRWAIEETSRAIQERARNFRNLVVAVVVAGALALVGSLLTRAFWPLTGLAVLIPVCGTALLADGRAVDRWRSNVLAAWTRGDVHLSGLRAAVRAHPRLPPQTLEGMLATLPAAGEIESERRIVSQTRRAAVGILVASQRGRLDALLLNTIASAVVVAATAAALWLRAWTPLAGLALLALRPGLGAWLRRLRQGRAAAELAASRREPGFDQAEFERLVASVCQEQCQT